MFLIGPRSLVEAFNYLKRSDVGDKGPENIIPIFLAFNKDTFNFELPPPLAYSLWKPTAVYVWRKMTKRAQKFFSKIQNEMGGLPTSIFGDIP